MERHALAKVPTRQPVCPAIDDSVLFMLTLIFMVGLAPRCSCVGSQELP